MRLLLFTRLLPLAFLAYFCVRRSVPKADSEEIYLWLFVSLIGLLFPFDAIAS